jgi:hypothetical protein
MKSTWFVLLIAFATAPQLMAKRVPPPDVRPVVLDGIEYAAHGDGTHGWITATDVATRRELWTAKVFRIQTHWWKGEEDNQWIFISYLQLEQNGLHIQDERCRCYLLNLNTRHVNRQPCSDKPAKASCR